MTTVEQEIIARLDRIDETNSRIEAMLKAIAYANSPASLSVDEKVAVMVAALRTGDKKAVKEAARQMNGM